LFLRVLLALFAARFLAPFLAPFFVPFFLPLAIVLPPGKIRTARIRFDSSRCRGPVRCGPCLWHSKVQHVRRTCSLSYAEHFGSACLSARMTMRVASRHSELVALLKKLSQRRQVANAEKMIGCPVLSIRGAACVALLREIRPQRGSRQD